MDKKALKEHLKALTELTGPSGFEGNVQAYLRREWADLVDEFDVDGLGSLIGIKRGSGKTPRKCIMLSAHMDEIALMVTEVREGYLRMVSTNGVDARILLAKPVLVHTATKTLKGVVAAVPPHISQSTGGTDNYPDFKEQWVDLGLPADEVAQLVKIGDWVTMDAPALELMGDKVAGKAMDDRSSVATVTACLHYLKHRNHNWDVYATASIQEEVGLFGAKTASFHINPDVAIALDVTFAQQNGVNGDEYVKLGEGPGIGIGPNFHDALYKSIQETAKAMEITMFVEPTPGGSGTDAWAIQVSRTGVPTTLLGIPLRNMHTPIETVSLQDIDRTARLMAEFIAGLAEDYLDTIQFKIDEDKQADDKKDDESDVKGGAA